MPVLECARCNEMFYSASGSTFARCERCGAGVWRVFEDESSFDRVAATPRRIQPADHAAIVYSDSEEAAAFCGRYVREGLDRDEFVVAVLPEPLRTALDGRLSRRQRGQLRLEEPAVAYGDFEPRRAVAWYEDMMEQADRPMRLLAGPDGDAAARISLPDWRLFERMVHERIVDLGVTVLCVYDGPSLPAEFIPVASTVHPLLVQRGGELRRNEEFEWDG